MVNMGQTYTRVGSSDHNHMPSAPAQHLPCKRLELPQCCISANESAGHSGARDTDGHETLTGNARVNRDLGFGWEQHKMSS